MIETRRPLASPYPYCWFHGWTDKGEAIIEKQDGTVVFDSQPVNILFADAPSVDRRIEGTWPPWWVR